MPGRWCGGDYFPTANRMRLSWSPCLTRARSLMTFSFQEEPTR